MERMAHGLERLFSLAGSTSTPTTEEVTMDVVRIGTDKVAVYDYNRRGPYGTPLIFKGTVDEYLAWLKARSS